MNTPRKMRRHDWQNPPAEEIIRTKLGTYIHSLRNSDYAVLFAAILTEFEHLESSMARVLAVLLSAPDDVPAGYVYRALRNPAIREDVLRDLLEKSPNNKTRGTEYDEMLSEYSAIRIARNGYAHGLWFTHETTKAVLLARRDEHGFAFLEAKPEPIKALYEVIERIAALGQRIHDATRKELPDPARPPSKPRRRKRPKP